MKSAEADFLKHCKCSVFSVQENDTACSFSPRRIPKDFRLIVFGLLNTEPLKTPSSLEGGGRKGLH